jgi:hypothetical protein
VCENVNWDVMFTRITELLSENFKAFIIIQYRQHTVLSFLFDRHLHSIIFVSGTITNNLLE